MFDYSLKLSIFWLLKICNLVFGLGKRNLIENIKKNEGTHSLAMSPASKPYTCALTSTLTTTGGTEKLEGTSLVNLPASYKQTIFGF